MPRSASSENGWSGKTAETGIFKSVFASLELFGGTIVMLTLKKKQGYCLGRRQSKHIKGRSKKASKETCQYECPSHFFESSASRQGTGYLKGRGLGEDDLI